ncbi:MAG: acyltransferase [Bacteroidaceae bacterium]|nr:acyltransferase [Bacteroidaceae bacterium]
MTHQTQAAPTPPPKRRNSGLDAMRALAALLVVAIHFGGTRIGTDAESLTSLIVNAEVRVAVPLFFMLTGYYYESMVARGCFGHHLRKLLTMAVGATLLYFFYELALSWHNGSLNSFLGKLLSVDSWTNWLIFNNVWFASHLWFFYAAVYALFVMRFFDIIKLQRWLPALAAMLLAVMWVSIDVPQNYYTRNFLFFALPYMVLGRWLQSANMRQRLNSFSRRKLLAMLTVGLLLVAGETIWMALSRQPLSPMRETFAGTLICAICLFELFVRCPNESGRLWHFSQLVGRKYSAYIYILHIIVGHRIAGFFCTDSLCVAIFISVPVIFIISLFLSYLYVDWMKPRLKH